MTLRIVINMSYHEAFLTSGLDLTGKHGLSIFLKAGKSTDVGFCGRINRNCVPHFSESTQYKYQLSMLIYPSKHPTLDQG